MILRTVGHGNRSAEEFIDLLKDAGVSYVVDVRSIPHSVRFPHFGSQALRSSLRRAGIDYIYLGDLLGGKPLPQEKINSQWRQGHLDPWIVASLRRTPRWKEGIQKLAALVSDRAATGQQGCLLCSETDPARCHRSFVALDLATEVPGLEISHLVSQHSRPREEVGVQEPLI